MPYKSEKQRKAMHAAAEGRGTIGILPSVAKEFIAHSEPKKSEPRKPPGKAGKHKLRTYTTPPVPSIDKVKDRRRRSK